MNLRALAGLSLIVAAGTGPLAAAQDGQPAHVRMLRVQHGTIEARVSAVPLSALLEALARETGASVTRVSEAHSRRVSVEFTPLPLIDGLERLLRSESFMATTRGTGDGTRLIALTLLGQEGRGYFAVEPSATAEPAAAASSPDSPGTETSEHETDATVADRDPAARVEAIQRLADHPGNAWHDLVARSMIDDPDVAVRREAFDTLASTGGLRADQTVTLLRHEPEAELRRHALPWLAEHARRDEAAWAQVAWLADNDPDRDVRAIATRIVERRWR